MLIIPQERFLFPPVISIFSSLIQTVLSVPEFFHLTNRGSHRFSRPKAGRGLYRRLGISPDPEDIIPFTNDTIPLSINYFKSFLSFYSFFQ